MKNRIRILALALVVLMCVSALPMTAAAYGSGDAKLIITHINESPSREGSAVIVSGGVYSQLGTLGTFAWWRVAIFDWDAEAKVYKVTAVYQNSNNSDKSTVKIPSTGFAYGICIGNDYSASGGINYKTQNVIDSCNYVTTGNMPVGTTAYLYNVDLSNGIVKNNGKNWYASDYASESYIKIGTPVEGETAYDPENPTILGYEIVPTAINKVTYASGECSIFTPGYGTYVGFSSGKYEWWTAVVFEWNDSAEGGSCYTVSSVSRAVSNSAPKQPIIPENGFAIVNCSANTDAMSNIRVGAQCWLYDINPEAGTLGNSPKICVSVPDETRSAFTPTYTDPRLTSPEVNEINADGYINTLASGTTVTWDAISGATEYVVAINDGNVNPDGTLLVLPTVVTTNSYAIPSSILSTGNAYTLWVYAVGTGYTASMTSHYTVKCVSASALNTSLKNKTIIAFGDSLTARTGYVNMLYGYLGTEVVNAGVGGNNTVHAKARFETDVLALDPDIVIICFGMNDQAAYVSSGKPIIDLATYRSNLEYFASTLQAAGTDVVFMTPNPVYTATGYYVKGGYGLDYGYGHMDLFCNAMREVAAEYGCGLIDINYECSFENMASFMAYGDGIHQSTAGHQRYAELISDYLFAAYDDTEKAVMTVTAKDSEGNTVKTYTYTGHVGAHITIATPEIEGYVTSDEDIKTTFADGASFSFTYSLQGLTPVSGSKYTVDEEKGYILGVAEKTLASAFNASFTVSVSALGADGNAIAGTKYVVNGATVKSGSKTYTVIIAGDVNGDGMTNSVDYLMLKRSVLGTYTLAGAGKAAGAITDGVTIIPADYIKLKRHVLGTYNLYA